MEILNPSDIKKLCEKHNFVPSKSYGQTYLTKSKPINEIIEASDIKKTDTVIEIGPGFGILTFALLEKAKKVIAFEIEKKLIPYWQEKKQKNLEVVWGDVLKNRELIKEKKYKLVANLPYQITSKVIRIFLQSINQPELIVLMIQKEVGERICAKPGKMSVLAVSVQYFSDPKVITSVSAGNFWPIPKVDSCVIKIKVNRTKKRNEEYEKIFFQIVKIGFSNKRKMLINNLMTIFKKENKQLIFDSFEKSNIKENARAQDLSITQWKDLVDNRKLWYNI